MKAFRRSFGKTTTFKHMFMPFLIPLLLFFIFYDYNLNSVAWCYLLFLHSYKNVFHTKMDKFHSL